MTDPFQETDEASTDLTSEQKKGLRLTYITTRDELNEAEKRNILDAESWVTHKINRRFKLDEDFLKDLHGLMFGDVWSWAGKYRDIELNLGIDHWRIQTEIISLLDQVAYWIENNSFSVDEIALRLHHKLTWIHPFPNGNGRHARLMADLLVMKLGGTRFTWGRSGLTSIGKTRNEYVAALKAADMHDYSLLFTFARS